MKKFPRAYVLLFSVAVTLLAFSSFYSIIPVWSSGSDIPVPVRAGNTASYSKGNNGWLLIVSGRDQADAIIKTVQRYNVNANAWDTLTPHPTGLLGAATAILKDSLYIIGGVVSTPGAGLNTVSKLSIDQNTWSAAANLPVTLVDAKAVPYQDSLIYTAGGVGGPNRGNIYLYNANTNTWRAATPFNTTGRRSFGGFAITGDTLVYMCGTLAFGSSTYFDSVYVGVINQSNRAVISWTRGANFPGQTRTFFDASKWGNGIIMTGGSTNNTFNTPTNECYHYSPTTNQWTQLPNKPTAWLTGQSGSVKLASNVWKLICTSGYASGYLSQTEILTDTLLATGLYQNNMQRPAKLALAQNHPNPFNQSTTIQYTLTESGHVTLKVIDAGGKEIATLVNKKQNPGSYSVTFDAGNLTSGVYYYTIGTGEFKETKKMQLAR